MSTEKTQKICIVSRHDATIKYLQQKYPSAVVLSGSVTAEELKEYGLVIGNLPLAIIKVINELSVDYKAVEFDKFPPRGVELTPEDLEKYGIRLVEYAVLSVKASTLNEFLNYYGYPAD